MRPSARPHVRRAALVGAAIVTFAACGDEAATDSGEPSATFQTNDTTAQIEVDAPAPDPVASDAAAPAPDPVPTDAAAPAPDPAPAVLGGREFAAAVEPSAEVATNLLPDLVVDDVRRGTQANFRNIFPADRPVLLWLWAPH